MIRAFVIAACLVLTAGCRSSEYNARVFHPWGCDNAKEFKARLDEYKNVFMVWIYEDHWEDRGPNKYSLHHVKGTVVRVYKGKWRVSEKIAFVQDLDSRAPTNPNSEAGSLGFVFTGQHTDAEIGLDTGEFSRYDTEHAPALEGLYPQESMKGIVNKTAPRTGASRFAQRQMERQGRLAPVADLLVP